MPREEKRKQESATWGEKGWACPEGPGQCPRALKARGVPLPSGRPEPRTCRLMSDARRQYVQASECGESLRAARAQQQRMQRHTVGALQPLRARGGKLGARAGHFIASFEGRIGDSWPAACAVQCRS